jgi:hypothetical protein
MLPEKWCLKLQTADITAAVNSVKFWKHGSLVWENKETYKNNFIQSNFEYASNSIQNGYKEISFQEFERYILNKEPQEIIPLIFN